MHTDHVSSSTGLRALCMLALLIVSVGTVAQGLVQRDSLSAEQDLRDKLGPFAQILADLHDRPRRVIYAEYPVSAQHGLVRGFVHVGDGSAVLARTDLVVDANLPIVIRRAYHSARDQSREFGATGWYLTLAERIERRPTGRFIYTYGNGTQLELDKQGRIESALQAYLTDVVKVRILSADELEVLTRTGLSKRFQRRTDAFVLASVMDPYSNRLDFQYTAGALSSVHSSSGAWIAFERDAHGRVIGIEDSHGRVVSYAYDAGRRLVAVVDAGGQHWNYNYDSANRLTSTITPNGIMDMEFQYDAQGRVIASRANGSLLNFAYRRLTTKVSDTRGLTTAYVTGMGGLTTEVTNALGTRTTLRLARSGVPAGLLRNGHPVLEFSDEQSSRRGGTRARLIVQEGREYELRYDAHHRVTRVLTENASGGFEVEQYGSGLVPRAILHADGSREEAQFDAHGELTRVTRRDGSALLFRRDGEHWRVEDASLRRVDLQFNTVGRLISARINKDQMLRFRYNDIGLRESTHASAGWNVQYQYDASGSLFYSSSGFSDTVPSSYNYILRADRRLDAIRASDGNGYQFLYDPLGRASEMRSAGVSNARFQYDELSRLTRVEHRKQDATAAMDTIDYSYASGEPDIAAQLSIRALPIFNQQKEISDFAPRFDIMLTRLRPAAMGLLTYDDVTDELTLAAEPLRWHPLLPVTASVAALRLEELLTGDGPAVNAFMMPSNRLFVPPEYFSVNCCLCPCPPSDPNCPPYSECEGCLPPPCGADTSLQTQTVATVPSNRARTKLGVGEQVTLSLNPVPSCPVVWSLSGNGSLSGTSGGSISFTAHERFSIPTVTATVNGFQYSVTFSVVEPISESAIKIAEFIVAPGVSGAGMRLRTQVEPADVSFRNIEFRELDNPASNITGYFTQFQPAELAHDTHNDWIPLSDGNEAIDDASGSGFPAPWTAGGFQWSIPVRWRVIGSTNEGILPTRVQTFTLHDATGRVTVSKMGQSVTRSP